MLTFEIKAYYLSDNNDRRSSSPSLTGQEGSSYLAILLSLRLRYSNISCIRNLKTSVNRTDQDLDSNSTGPNYEIIGSESGSNMLARQQLDSGALPHTSNTYTLLSLLDQFQARSRIEMQHLYLRVDLRCELLADGLRSDAEWLIRVVPTSTASLHA